MNRVGARKWCGKPVRHVGWCACFIPAALWVTIGAVTIPYGATRWSHFLLSTASAESTKVGATPEIAVGSATPVRPEESPSVRFTRIRRDANGKPVAVQTSVASYRDSRGRVVDLVSAIHVGEGRYYDALNKAFESYDSVLFELIAPEGIKITKDRPDNAVSFFQHSIQSMLKLEFQLDRINYNAKNMVHADVNPDEFFHDLANSRGSVWDTLGQLLVHAMEERKKRDPVEEFKVMVVMAQGESDARTFLLRRYLADRFGDVDELVKRIDGIIGDAIVARRNAKALAVLKARLQKGEKRLAIFYGAAHMPDMEQHLMRDLHFERGDVRWLAAWCLEPDPACDADEGAHP